MQSSGQGGGERGDGAKANTESIDLVVKFPWRREGPSECGSLGRDRDAKPGEFVLQSIFLEFCRMTEKKIEHVLAEPLEKSLSKSLQRGEDLHFDQILNVMGCVAEHSLPSILKSLFLWYERQLRYDDSPMFESRHRHRSKGSKDFLCERRDLAVEFVNCLVLIEVLTKNSYHPGHDDMINYIISTAFKHFRSRDSNQTNPNSANINIIADLYAEVIGILATSRFQAIRKTFMNELRELKLRDQTPYTAQAIISLLMGLKFFRVKLHPIEEFEANVAFLHELGVYFLEVKDREIKHALAGLFVEILLPVSATAKNEVNVPVLKNFVELLYSTTVDMTTKRKHTSHLFPLVTCLLCVSHKTFFLNNWPYFLTSCLSQLKNKDAKMSRIALESLYRLLWVYMVRIKCESNTATASRLQSIVNSLFPKGSKIVTPKDTPLNIFVKIIQFIAKERLEFAMKDIIFDLLCVGKPVKFSLTPERMSIGLRAFLVIADSLQQRDGDPPMPQSSSTLPSGSTVRVKRTFLNKMLTETTAKQIGVQPWFPHILKTFDAMLRALDLQVGRPLLMTKAENANKEPDEVIIGDRKPKIDLFRTCIAAIPRLVPEGMNNGELVELLTRLTVHIDEELKGLAFQALQNLMSESYIWKEYVLHGFIQFVMKDISDNNTQLLDGALRMLMQLLVQWKSNNNNNNSNNSNTTSKDAQSNKLQDRSGDTAQPTNQIVSLDVLHEVEGLALVMMCSCRMMTRKLAVILLKEVRNIFNSYSATQVYNPCLLDAIDRACPTILERLHQYLPPAEKSIYLTLCNIDLSWVVDKAATTWATADGSSQDGNQVNYSFHRIDLWIRFVAAIVSKDFALTSCPLAIGHAWPIVYTRLTALFPLVDPSTQTNDNRASSILRGSKKLTTEKDVHMQLWQNYVVMACSIAQQGAVIPHRCSSPELGNSSPESIASEKTESRTAVNSTASNLFHLLVPLLKCENSDMKDMVVNGLGYCNPAVFKELAEELLPYIKDAIDKKQDNLRRRRKRDLLRLHLAHIFELIAANKTFAQSETGIIDKEHGCLSSMFVDYIDGARQYLEGESDRDLPILQQIRLHFSGFIQNLISNTPLDLRKTLLSRELRYSLFHLFANWSGHFSHTFGTTDRRLTAKEEVWNEQELCAVKAMTAVLCCGRMFDTHGLNDDGSGYIYNWLDTLLSSHDEKIYDLAKETVFLLLEFNSDVQSLLDWVIDRCYTGSNEVADGCFNALAAVFQTREYPCDHVAMLNLAVLNVGNPRIQTHETAQMLLHLLDTRFFQEIPIVMENAEEQAPPCLPLNDILLAVSYCHSQVYLSEQLANIHPDLTLPMISEITHRFQTARPSVRQTLLKCLLPWLHNMELVDPSLPPSNPLSTFLTRLQDNQTDSFMTSLRGDGWGSTQATEMALNNIFFLTAKFGDEHPFEIESLWSSLLTWPNNLKVIIRYLVIITNVAASDLLLYVKRVLSYLGRAKPEKLVDELMNELQSIETLNMSIERTQTPPYYRLSPMRKIPATNNTTDDEKIVCQTADQLEKGILHTKRHSTNEDLPSDGTTRTNSTASLRSITSTVSSTQDQVTLTTEEEIRGPTPTFTKPGEHRRSESPLPYPLPMPAYGGYFAPLNQFLPENLPSTPGFHRSNIAIMFLSDLVLDGLEIDWSPHLPLMLHVIFLGLDHSRPLVYEHCKKLLLNLLLLASSHDHSDIARLLLENRRNPTDTVKIISEDRDSVISVETPPREANLPHQMVARSTFSIDSSATITPETTSTMADPDSFNTVEEVAQCILNFMDNKRGRPLWSCDDITPKMLNTQSATHLEYFLKCVVRCFKEIYPLALVEQRWSQTALQLALSCSSRHYAGRSFQILRALRIRPSTQMLSDILSRLVETVAEQGEDMQGYVTEIMLTLEAAVDNLDLEFRPIDFMRELFMSTPNLANDSDGRRPGMTAPKQALPHHCRSTSYSVAVITQKARAAAIDLRNRSSTDADNRRSNLARSRSAQSLKNLDQNGTEDKITLLTQMFWICVSLLESDYEYEFLLAVRLLDKMLCHLQPERPECREKLEKILQQIKWPNFPGLQTLLLKGCTSNMACEATWSLLARVVLCINAPIMDPSGMWGFPMNVMAMLPYMVHNYEKNNKTCRDAADNVAQMCNQQSERLNNLGTVMTLYSRGTFGGKDSFQWTKCVVKYLHDVYSAAVVSMVTFLVEILEKGPSMYQSAVLQILHCMVHYIDINSTPSSLLNSELFNSASKHVQGANFKEALKILKLAVTRSSTLAAAPPVSSSISSELNVFSHTSFAEAEIFTRIPKELPGRTLDFSVDLSKTPIIGRKYLAGGDNTKTLEETSQSASPSASASSSTVSLSRKPSNNQDIDSVWRRPQASQARTRERLVNLLTCFGQRVGLPKSPSVIFSQSSDTLDHQQSVASSGEEASLPEVPSNEGLLHDSSGNELMMTFKGFDFLDNELESENEDFFSQLDRRTSINMESSPTSISRRPHHYGSVPDLNIIGVTMQEIPISPSDSISVKEETVSNDETSSAADEGSVPQDLAASNSILVQNATLQRERRHSSPLTASTHSLYSNHSETDIVELSGNTASPSFSHLHALYFNLQSDEVEEVWRGHVAKVLGEVSLTHAVSTCQIFPRLFREMRRRLMTMCKEACYYISKADSLKSVASQILQVLDMVYLQMECPFIYVESDTLLGSRVVEKHRFCVLEIQECFETYYMRKDQAEQSLESLKSNIKQQSLFDGVTMSTSGDEQKVDLCRKLYKLIFQLVQFFESYLKLLEVFRSVTRTPQVVDMSLQATSLQVEMSTALQELENGQASPFNVDFKAVNKQEAITSLAEYLQTQQYLKAVQLLRSFRSLWPNDVFGMTSEDDVVALLNIYCSSLSDKKTGIFVLTRTDLDLNHLHSHLMNIHLKLSTAWPPSLSSTATTPTRLTEVVIKQSDSSTL